MTSRAAASTAATQKAFCEVTVSDNLLSIFTARATCLACSAVTSKPSCTRFPASLFFAMHVVYMHEC